MQEQNSKFLFSSFQGNRTVLYAGIAVAIFVVVITALLTLLHLRQQAEMRTAVTTQNLSRSVEQTIEGMIDTIDITLLTSADEIGRRIVTGNVDVHATTRFLERQLKRLPHMSYLRASNERGDVIYGPGVLPLPNNISDREYFIRLRDDPNGDFLVSQHLVGRIAGKWAWLFARRINKPDGTFGGVVFAAILADQIEAHFSHIQIDSGGSIVVRDTNMGLIARYSPATTTKIQPGDKQLSTPFVDALHANPLEGTYISGATSIDGISRTHSYRRNAKYGFIINVGIAGEAALGDWYKEAGIVAGLVVAFMLALLAFVWTISHAWRRQEQDLTVLADSQQALHEAQQIANLGQFTIDLRTKRWTSSEILDRIFGIGGDYPRDVEHMLKLVVPESRQEFQAYFNIVVEQRIFFEREYRIARPIDGEERWVHAQGRLRFDAQGSPLVLTGTIQDITERKHSEEILRESETRLQDLFENLSSGVAVYRASPDGRDFFFTAFNRAAERIENMQREDLLGKNVVEVFPSITEFGLLEALRRVWQSGAAEHLPISFYHDDRITGWRENYIYKLPSGEIVAIYDEVTREKQAEKEKDELRRNQQALLNAIQETTFLIKRDGTILVINEIGARRLNAKPEELAGKSIFDHLPPKVAEWRRSRFDEIALNGKPEIFEDELPGHRYFNAVYPIRDAQDKVTRFAVYAADITQQHRQKAIDDMLSEINQKILQGVPLHEVLTEICQKVAEAFQLEVVWLGRKEPGGAISILAAAGTATNYFEQLKTKGVRWDDTPQGRGPAGSAIRFGQTQTYKVNDPRFRSWSGIAPENNLQSILAVPLVIRSEIYGVFSLYSSNPVLFDSPELSSQLNSIGKRICIALEAAMDQQQVRLLSSALEAAGNGVIITDPQGKIQWANPAFSKLCGYTKQELLGQTPRILNSGQQSPEYYQALWATISKGENWSSETVERSRDGNLYTVSQTITPIINDGELTNFISIHEDISAQKLSQERIAHMAHYDALTGLPNRALFYDRLRQALALAKRNENGLALLYMDLDGFKQVNDNLGHHAGDLLLMGVADRLSKSIRESDTVARLGGDEFTIILNKTHKYEDVTRVAQKIIETISAPFDIEGHQAHIGISIGIARYAEEASDEDELMKLADQAMYDAKSAGKNTYRLGETGQK